MVKPIGSSPQSTPVKTEVEQTGENIGKEQTGRSNQTAPIYSAKAQNARKAEHSFAGQAQAMKLLAEFEPHKAAPKMPTSPLLLIQISQPQIKKRNRKSSFLSQ